MDDTELVAELVIRWEEAWEQGHDLPAEELCADAPELVPQVQENINALKQMQWIKSGHTGEEDELNDPSISNELPLPHVLGNRYRIDSLIAEGGFGKVYRGFDPELDRSVAVKIPRLWHSCSPEQADALLEEARRAARLKHPHIVAVYDVGRSDGMCFIVSDLIEGQNLADYLTGHRPSPEEAVQIAAVVADALHFAHEQGFIHRDIKPANILIDQSSQPHVTDFGIATTIAELAQEQRVTTGTLAYMSPEQVGNEGHLIGAGTDIYALGVVLYEMLTGTLPYSERTPSGLREQILFGVPTPFADHGLHLSKKLAKLCLKCLSKHPKNRPSTMKSLAEALRTVTDRSSKSLTFPVAVAAGLLILGSMAIYRRTFPLTEINSVPASQAALPTLDLVKELQQQSALAALSPETTGMPVQTSSTVFLANRNQVWVMNPNANAIFYSFDGITWDQAFSIVRTPFLCRGEIDHAQLKQTDRTDVLVKYTDDQENESSTFRVALMDSMNAPPGLGQPKRLSDFTESIPLVPQVPNVR